MEAIRAFENSAQITEIKSILRELFLSMLDGLQGAWTSFYEWLKNVPLPVPPTMLKMFSNNKANFILFCLFVAYIIYANVKAYRAFALDKKRAIQNGERIPEKNLMRLMWIGGSAGAALAMFLLRHKTLHKKFTVTVCILLFLQLMIASFILGFLAFWAFF